MDEQLMSYEQRRDAIRLKTTEEKRWQRDLDEFDSDYLQDSGKQVILSDVAQVGSKVLIGGGVGLLAGVAGIAVVASAAEVVVAGVVTKIAGVVGCAVGLSLGLKGFKNKKKRHRQEI